MSCAKTLAELAPDPAREDRRNRCVAMLVLDPEISNALVADRTGENHVALAFAVRTRCGAIHYSGECLVPLTSWDGAIFARYAQAMRDGKAH